MRRRLPLFVWIGLGGAAVVIALLVLLATVPTTPRQFAWHYYTPRCPCQNTFTFSGSFPGNTPVDFGWTATWLLVTPVEFIFEAIDSNGTLVYYAPAQVGTGNYSATGIVNAGGYGSFLAHGGSVTFVMLTEDPSETIPPVMSIWLNGTYLAPAL